MNNTIKLAVAAALLAGASSAQAGIMIPAGDWTLDIGGVVNAYYTNTKHSGAAAGVGLGGPNSSTLGVTANGNSRQANITTGLLPNYLSVSGKTRQNDLDVGFTISINPGASTVSSGNQGSQQENRQAFVTFGDASWGSIKLGKDLGIYASDAILNDMTLLGVGSGAGFLAGNTTTLGRIGSGFMYADWKSQVAYSSPNWNGFSFTAGLTQAWNATKALGASSTSSSAVGGSETAYEGKASYSWGGDFAGKVWASGLSQKVKTLSTATAWDIGANVNAMGFGATAYYGEGKGTGTTVQFRDGFDNTGAKRDSKDWYVQGTYTLPTVGTKLGVSYGKSTLEDNGALDTLAGDYSNEMITFGAYHPLTKHLNLVAEYSEVKGKVKTAASGKDKTVALGAILFF
jgi:predicted porin